MGISFDENYFNNNTPSNSENYSNNSGTYKSSKMGEKSEMKVNHIIYLKLWKESRVYYSMASMLS